MAWREQIVELTSRWWSASLSRGTVEAFAVLQRLSMALQEAARIVMRLRFGDVCRLEGDGC